MSNSADTSGAQRVQVVELFGMVQIEHVRHFSGKILCNIYPLKVWLDALVQEGGRTMSGTSEVGWDVELLTRHGRKRPADRLLRTLKVCGDVLTWKLYHGIREVKAPKVFKWWK